MHTGDIGHFDSKGWMYVTDRKKELIKYKGFQVIDANAINNALMGPGADDITLLETPQYFHTYTYYVAALISLSKVQKTIVHKYKLKIHDSIQSTVAMQLLQVPPAELEALILTMDVVKDAIVIPVLDDEAGEVHT